MENTNKITLLEIKRRHTEIWKKENELKALIKQNDKMLEDKRIEIELMNWERTDFILEYIRQNPDRMKEGRINFNIIIKGSLT
jgi:hypothetical protein